MRQPPLCRIPMPALALLFASVTLGPAPAGAAVPLAELLDHTSRQVSAYVTAISRMNCTEHVEQVKLGESGKALQKQESTFDYLVILTSTGGEINLVESRLDTDRSRKIGRKDLPPLLVSNGLSMLFLVFHPAYASGFEFSLGDEDTLGGRRFQTVQFRHIRGTRSPAALAVRGREYQLDLSGLAWIDPDTGAIAKMTAGLDGGMEDLGLRLFDCVVEFQPVSFQAPAEQDWLPARVTVEVESRRQHWRNVHRFSKYRRFSVATNEQVARP